MGRSLIHIRTICFGQPRSAGTISIQFLLHCTCMCYTAHACATLHMHVLHCTCMCYTAHACATLHMHVLHCTCMCYTAHACATLHMHVLHCTCMCYTAHACACKHTILITANYTRNPPPPPVVKIGFNATRVYVLEDAGLVHVCVELIRGEGCQRPIVLRANTKECPDDAYPADGEWAWCVGVHT